MNKINKLVMNEWFTIALVLSATIVFIISQQWFAAGWSALNMLWIFLFRTMRLKKELLEKQFHEYIETHKEVNHG